MLSVHSGTYTYNKVEILQTCFLCSLPVKLDTEETDVTQCAMGHISSDGSYLSILHPVHLSCAAEMFTITDKCIFCDRAIKYVCIERIKQGASGHMVALSTVTEAVWKQAQEKSTLFTEDQTALSSLLKAMSESNLSDDETELSNTIKQVLTNSVRDRYSILLLSAAAYGSVRLLKLLKAERGERTIHPNVLAAAIAHADEVEDKSAKNYLESDFRPFASDLPERASTTEEIRCCNTHEINKMSIDGYPFRYKCEATFHQATIWQKWHILEELIKSDTEKSISADYIKRAWQAAAGAGDAAVLTTITTFRTEALSKLQYEERIRALAQSPEVNSAEIDHLILPTHQRYELTASLLSWALSEIKKTGKQKKLAHLLQHTNAFYPLHLQKWLTGCGWLTGFGIAEDPTTFEILRSSKIPLSSSVRGEYLLALVESEDPSIERITELFSRSVFPVLEARSGEEFLPENPEFAPITLRHIVLALKEAVRTQNKTIIQFLLSLGKIPLKQEDVEMIERATTIEGKQSPSFILIQHAYPEYAAKQRPSTVDRPFSERLKEWFGSISKVWKALSACFR
jgi:hypothetical protein